ncbi:MAG: arsenic efflux protein [Clostridia bacterium]|nr:arsenic efflux protein [Clostridia bacterium]
MTETLHLLIHSLKHAFLDTLSLLPFLFVTYFFMEFIEHSAKDKTERIIKSAGKFGAVLGGLLGALPQCAFSAVVAGLFSGGVITLGTLFAVFLSTSDEMLPIMISRGVPFGSIALIVITKVIFGIGVGMAVDAVYKKKLSSSEISHICEEEGCRCHDGIIMSALRHTLSVSAFILIFGTVLEFVMAFLGEDVIARYLANAPILSHFAASFVGLIPNCASSVLFTELYIEKIISAGTMMSGLFSSAGVGILVLFKTNKNIKENILIVALLFIFGAVLGGFLDLINFS